MQRWISQAQGLLASGSCASGDAINEHMDAAKHLGVRFPEEDALDSMRKAAGWNADVSDALRKAEAGESLTLERAQHLLEVFAKAPPVPVDA